MRGKNKQHGKHHPQHDIHDTALTMTMDDLLGSDDDDNDNDHDKNKDKARPTGSLQSVGATSPPTTSTHCRKDNSPQAKHPSSSYSASSPTTSMSAKQSAATAVTPHTSGTAHTLPAAHGPWHLERDARPPGAAWLTAGELAALCRLLYPPTASDTVCQRATLALLQQKLVFDSVLPYALLQQQRGVGAVLAPIQAALAGCYFEKESYVETTVRQRTCLSRALVALLLRAQPDVCQVKLVAGCVTASSSASSSPSVASSNRTSIEEGVRALVSWWRKSSSLHGTHTDHDGNEPHAAAKEEDALSPWYVWTGFDSREALSSRVDSLVLPPSEQQQCGGGDGGGWCTSCGGGLWCVLASLLLSRKGELLSVVDADVRGGTVGEEKEEKSMRATGGRVREAQSPLCLLDPRSGCGTVALARVMLTGGGGGGGRRSEKSNGTGTRWECGFVDADGDVDGSLESETVSSSADDPVWPSWVIHHAGHFSNLFMKKDMRKGLAQRRALGGEVTVAMSYWDPASGEDEYNLKVSIVARNSMRDVEARQPGSRSSNRASFVNCAIHAIPMWRHAVIDWNGEVPPYD